MMHSEGSSTGQSAQEAEKLKPMDLDSTEGTPYTAGSSFSFYAVVLDSYPTSFSSLSFCHHSHMMPY